MLRQGLMAVTKNIKYLIALLVFFAFGALLWHPFSGYYHDFHVTYSQHNHPFVTTNLNNIPSTLKIGIGCRFPLFLQQETLDGINKQFLGTEIYHTIDGHQQETPYYLVPNLKIEDLVLKNVVVYQGHYDFLGKNLGGEFNLLLDFPHDRITVCDSFSKLKNKQIANKNWIQLPFEMHRTGIAFNVVTDFGMRKLVLNTESAISCLSSHVFPNDARLPYISSSFALSGHRFPNVIFESIELPEDLNEIDGFIGMDFLKEHAMYIDYSNKMAYIAPSSKYFERIPVAFNKRNAPIIEVVIQGSSYPFKLDLGNSFSFSLGNEILRKINKTQYGSCKWHDFRGNQYESPIYTIPEITISTLKFPCAFVNQDSNEFHANTTLIGEPLAVPGVVGLPILQKYNLLLDFPHSAIYASNTLADLQEAGLFSNNFLEIPFTVHADGIIFSAETDAGTYRLVLDTGATSTAIRAPHPAFTSKFNMMGHDFGKCSIMPIDLSSQFEFDGCLGMDFLLEHPIFIDYSNKALFIDLK